MCKPGLVVHTCNPSTQETEAGKEDQELKVSLSYIIAGLKKQN